MLPPIQLIRMWTNTDHMNHNRYLHTASVLATGNVLVVDEYSGRADLSSAELYQL